MKHTLTIAFSVDTNSCSLAARVAWCENTAIRLDLLDDEVRQLWMLGEFSDRDLLDNIVSHGDLRNLCASESQDVRHAANTLYNQLNNLLQGLILSEDGNFELSR